ncbi:signal transduction histidine kinase [Pseudonocardia endophytica]|uniref:histidine kinase n=1 Tax=Pseudonocardia endophytica TaxID=401976 RepID=A0A4V2PJ29_PSEEN|nr:signal transduction histidine kinase [Pseudonocardia endophytica]
MVERYVEWCRRNPVVVDAVLAVLVALIGIALARSAYSPRVQWDQSTVVAVVAAAPIVLRRRFPLPSAIVTAVIAAVALSVIGVRGLELPVLIMGYSVVVYGPRWAGPLMAGVMLFGGVLPFAVRGGGAGAPAGVLVFMVVVSVLVALCVWLAGALRRARRRSVEQLRERARLLEEGRRQEVRLELLAERARISREVHDVVAHSLSGIIAQADGGQYAATRDPGRAVDVLAGIATTGREALNDVRGLLDMLRDTAPVDDTADGGPQPGADDVPALVEQVRAGGLPVTFGTSGTPATLTTGAGLAVYRVVQEALTNVVKHAGPSTPARVGMDWGRDELTVEIRDDGASGPRPTPPRGGHGLVGMRERAALHGGSVETGPNTGGGFTVRMRLPYARTDRTVRT